MKLGSVKSVVQLGNWLEEFGFTPGEHPKFGGVDPVHSATSLHYVGQALDVNVRTLKKEVKQRFKNEEAALQWLYGRILGVAEAKDWPLDEMFFNGYGFLKERGYNHNHPIGGHDGHLHVGFSRKAWRTNA